MKWINKSLRSVWHQDDWEDVYKLVLEIRTDWRTVSDELYKVYNSDKRLKDYYLHMSDIIHDGNGKNGVVLDWVDVYHREGYYGNHNPFMYLYDLLFYMRSAEVLLELFKHELGEK